MPISRRAFVQSATALAAAAIAAPYIRASNKSGLGPVTVGEGEHLYECIHDWATLPPTHAFGNTHGVAVDSDGNIHVKHTVHASSSSPPTAPASTRRGTSLWSSGSRLGG